VGREDVSAKIVLRSNVRKAFRENRGVTDPAQQQKLLENGRAQLSALESILNNTNFNRVSLILFFNVHGARSCVPLSLIEEESANTTDS